MKFKKIILNLENEIDLKTWSSLNKSHNSYNDIKFGSVYFLRVLEKTKKHFFFTTIILLYFYRKNIIKNKIISVKLFCNC